MLCVQYLTPTVKIFFVAMYMIFRSSTYSQNVKADIQNAFLDEEKQLHVQ